MDIHIRLAGVELGPYTEKQVRSYLSEGLLVGTDVARKDGTDDWIAVDDLLAMLPPAVDAPTEPEAADTGEESKRAPEVAPGVTHLPGRTQETKRTLLLGPTAPDALSSSGRTAYSTVTTSPLVGAKQGTKKVARDSLLKGNVQKTAPLPTTKSLKPSPEVPSTPPPIETETAPPTQKDPKKSAAPSLIRALTAKTVPMRSPQAPPLPARTFPVTEPLPTKAIYKPATGAMSAAAKASGVDEKAKEQLVMPDEGPTITSSPKGPFLVDTAKIPPPKKRTSEKTASEQPVDPLLDAAGARRAPRRILRSLIFVTGIVAALALYYVWSPYHALASLQTALAGGDPSDLAATIDFDAVRSSLKDQIASSATPGAKANSPAGNASSTASAMIDRSIDRYVTRDGIAALMKKSDQAPIDRAEPTISPEVAQKLLVSLTGQPVKSQGLAGLGDFAVDKDVAVLHLQFQSLGWKLKRIELRPNLIQPASTRSSPSLITPVVDTYLESGAAKMQKNDLDGAIADFTQVLAIDPQSGAAYCARGGAEQAKGDLDKAIVDYTQAITIDPRLTVAYVDRGNVKSARNDLDGAIADYTQALQIDPSLAAVYDSRGNARTAKDDLDGAIADFTQAIALDPDLAGAYSDRGFARQANGNLDGAISDYTQALALKPKMANAYYNRGLARLSQGNLDAAIIDFGRALAFDPKIAEAYYNRGNAKSALHELDDAIADYTQAVALNPKQSLAYCNRGLARQAKGDLDGAVADYTQALSIDPKISIAYYNRGLIEAQKNNLDGAIADSTQALYLDPKNAQAYYNRGFAKLTKGNLQGALDDLQQFCDLAPRDHDADHARLYLWLIAKAQNSKADADQELSDALERNWNSPSDDLTSKTAMFLLGHVNEADYLAAAASPDAKKDQGQSCEAWYFAGMKRLLMGDKPVATDDFHKCLATGQTDYCEYILAHAELPALEPVPPTSTASQPVPAKSP